MPPKKDAKKQAVGKADNSGIPKQDIQFKLTFTAEVTGEQIPEVVVMYEWFGVTSDKIQRFDTGLLQTWQKKQSLYNYEKSFDLIRVDDEFCTTLSKKKFFVYFVNPQTNQVIDQILIDYSSLMMARGQTQHSFQYSSSTVKVYRLDNFTLKMTADKQLLLQVFRQYLNPFQIDVIGALDIPFDQNSQYQPAYVKFQFYDGQTFQTNGIVGNQKLIWKHKHVFLAGLINHVQLKEKIRSNYLKVQFHDRDQIQNKKLKQEIPLFDVTRAIEEQLAKQAPVEEDPKKKGAKKQPQKKQVKKDVKKDTKKKDVKLGQPILPQKVQIFKNNYGVAAFYLVQFLKSSMKTARYKSPVIPRNTFQDFQSKNIDLNTTARNQMQKIVFSNNYFERDTSLVVGFTLSYPIGEFAKNQSTKKQGQQIKIQQKLIKSTNNFERVVYVLGYKDKQTIKTIQNIFYQTNLKAFNLKSKRQLTTYLLKNQEKQSFDLDYLSGIQIIDPQARIYIIQGLKQKSIQKLYQALPKEKFANKKQKLLKNSSFLFTKRLYSDFNIQLKRIRLRPSLSQILLDPSIYIKSKVDQQICLNFNRINDIKRICQNLSTLDSMNLWPSTSSLIQIQRKYSQSLTFQDITGQKQEKAKSKVKNQAQTEQIKVIDFLEKQSAKFHTAQQFFLPKILAQPVNQTTNTFNDNKATWKRQVHTKTFNKDPSKSSQKYDMKLIKTTGQINQPVYIYAGQRLNWYEKQMRQARQMIQNDGKHLYTYSKDYLGLTVDPRNQGEQYKKQLELSKTKQFAKQAFSSLLVRTKQQKMKLPKKPGEEDIKDLIQYPYHQQKQRERILKQSERDKPLNNGKNEFKKYLRQQQVFSEYQVLELEKVPRAQQQKKRRQMRKKLQQQERKKLLGDPFMKIKKGYCADKVIGVDKYSNILQGSPTKAGLFDVNKKTKQKKIVQNYEVSLFQKQDPVNAAINPLVRKDNPSLNTGSYQFNNYQIPEVLTKTSISKPLKQN